MTAIAIITVTIAAVGAVVALATFAQAVVEYKQQGRHKRSAQFFELRSKLKDNPDFRRLAELLDFAASSDSDERAAAELQLRETSFAIKRDYVGLFEEVALVVNS